MSKSLWRKREDGITVQKGVRRKKQEKMHILTLIKRWHKLQIVFVIRSETEISLLSLCVPRDEDGVAAVTCYLRNLPYMCALYHHTLTFWKITVNAVRPSLLSFDISRLYAGLANVW